MMMRPTTIAVLLAFVLPSATGFAPMSRVLSSSSSLSMSTETPPSKETAAASEKAGYVPKWKKKQTLADESGDLDFKDKGIKGTISVVFKQGNVTKTTMAMPGMPLRDAATQAGQFIKYGCGKGECGTCEAMCGGKWIRPCTEVVPAEAADGAGEVVVIVKEIASATTSSGTFFSVKSFFMGFYNNILGMVGFVKYRSNAKKNWEERQEYEDSIKQLTIQKKLNRKLALQKEREEQNSGGFSP